MKNLFAASILILMFCIVSFAQTNQTLPCPKIDVIGPAGIIEPGDVATFTATLGDEKNYSIFYVWTVTGGTIVEGQNTAVIKVSIPFEVAGKSLSATVEVKGLPENCVSYSSEAPVISTGCRLPIDIDEYEKIPVKEEKGRLTNVASVLKNQPEMAVLFIIRVPKTEKYQSIKNRVSNISDYLTQVLKIPKERFGFVFSEDKFQSTRIQAIPLEIFDNLPDLTKSSLENFRLQNNSSINSPNE